MSHIDPDTGLEGFQGWEATARGIFCSHNASHGARGARIYRIGDHVTCEWCLADWADILIELHELGKILGLPKHTRGLDGEDSNLAWEPPMGTEVMADFRESTTGGATEERSKPGYVINLWMEMRRLIKPGGENYWDGDGA